MKAKAFSFIKISDHSMVASVNVARYIRDELQVPLTDNDDIAEGKADVLILINGAFAFCGHLEALAQAILNAKRIIWVMNDYSIVPPINNGKATSPFRRAFVVRREKGKSHLDYWTTCAKESTATPLSSYVNWNCLSMRERQKPKSYVTYDDLVYYGSFRTGRQKYFDALFKDPQIPITISSPSKKFEETYPNPYIRHLGAETDNLIEWLSQHGLGLYLEDRKSHLEFHSPPNRFYEMLSAGLPMIFPEESGFTLRRAGYAIIDRHIFSLKAGIPKLMWDNINHKMNTRNAISKEQHTAWFKKAMGEKELLPHVIKQAWKKVEDAI
jgi:hypothetical protein